MPVSQSEPFTANVIWKLRWRFRTLRCRISWHTGPFTKIQPRQDKSQIEVEHVVPGTVIRYGAIKKCGWCGATWQMGYSDEWERLR